MNDTFDPEKLPVKEEEEEAQTELKNEEDSDDDIEIIEDDGEEESGDVDTPKDEVDEDALWDNMVVINSKRKKGDAKLSRKKLK